MDGGTPAYRDLSSADSDGPDILELNRNLAALGFNANGIVVDDEWQEATTLGVELLQESLGESPTGSLSLGEVVFLPGPQLVSTVDGTVGDTANGGGTGTLASATVDPPAPQFVSLTTPGASLTTTTRRRRPPRLRRRQPPPDHAVPQASQTQEAARRLSDPVPGGAPGAAQGTERAAQG